MSSDSVSNEIQLISDGDGLAVIGDPVAVERYLVEEGLMQTSVPLPKVTELFRHVSTGTQAVAGIQQHSGRWIKMTKESAQLVSKKGLMPSKKTGISHAMIGKPGEIQKWIGIENSPISLLSNPAVLSGAAGIMAQMAMQQSMAEITDYLVTIDQKLDDVISHQKNEVLAKIDGVRLAIDEAISIRDSVGRVSEVTWSKIQNSSGTILETQGMALRKLGDLAEKMEKGKKVSDLAETFGDLESQVKDWITVLAECFRLHDALAIIELDRVFDASPVELDEHRMGLKKAREDRLVKIASATHRMLGSMNIATNTANLKVLFNPRDSKNVVTVANQVAGQIEKFHEMLAIGAGWDDVEARDWKEAASDAVDKTRVITAKGIGVAKDFTQDASGHARSLKGKLSSKIADRLPRKDSDGDEK